MAKTRTQNILVYFMVGVGFALLIMYAVLAMNGSRPSVGMLVVGLVDLVVGIVLLGRAKKGKR